MRSRAVRPTAATELGERRAAAAATMGQASVVVMVVATGERVEVRE